jgi:DNA-binding response OmpR family regulator
MAKAAAVLVVDDEPPIRRFLRTSLVATGYRVIEAEDAAGAMRLFLPSATTWSCRGEIDPTLLYIILLRRSFTTAFHTEPIALL